MYLKTVVDDQRGCYIKTEATRVGLEKKSQGAWLQDELSGGKLPVIQ
jgi:hypothetical protein